MSKMTKFITLLFSSLYLVIGLGTYRSSSYRGKSLFQVGDCITPTSHLEALSKPRESWESEPKLSPSASFKILEKGENSYRVQGYYTSSLEYDSAYIYTKVDCKLIEG